MNQWATVAFVVWWNVWLKTSLVEMRWICILQIWGKRPLPPSNEIWDQIDPNKLLYIISDHSFKFLIRKCTIWCMPIMITPISTSVIVGFCLTSNVNWFIQTSLPHGKSYGLLSMSHPPILCFSWHSHFWKPIEKSSFQTTWTSLMLSNFLTVRPFWLGTPPTLNFWYWFIVRDFFHLQKWQSDTMWLLFWVWHDV